MLFRAETHQANQFSPRFEHHPDICGTTYPQSTMPGQRFVTTNTIPKVQLEFVVSKISIEYHGTFLLDRQGEPR